MRFHLIPKLIPLGCRYQLITHEDQRLDYFVDETMCGSLLEVLKRPWYSRILSRPWMSWEIEAISNAIKYFYWAPQTTIGEEVRQKILAYYPDIEIWPAEATLEMQHHIKGTRLRLRNHYSVTIKTFFNDLVDTHGTILNAMTSLKDSEKAYLQILLRPAVRWRRGVKKAQKIVINWVEDETRELVAKSVHGKSFKTCGEIEVRIIAESPDKTRAEQIVKNIARSFGQFASESLNALDAKEFTIQPLLLHDFKRRIYPFYTRKNHRRILNIEELSGLIRLPSEGIKVAQLLRLRMKKVAAPVEIMVMAKEVEDGVRSNEKMISLGVNVYGFQHVPVWLDLNSLIRHMAIWGMSQMGKSALIANLCQTIMRLKLQGHRIGFELIDPHGSLCQNIAALVPPELMDQVDYIKPAYENGAFPFNVYDTDFNCGVDRVAQSVADALHRIWPDNWGPNVEDCLLQAGMALQMTDRGATIINVIRLLGNKNYREEVLEELHLTNREAEGIIEFFNKLDELTPAKQDERTNSTLNKLRKIQASSILRNSVKQKTCGIKWRRGMDEGRITLLDLSELSGDDARILGSIALTRRHQAALSRIDTLEKDRTLFLEIIDEAPLFIDANEKAIEAMADQCRKFQVGLVLACQGIDEQIPDKAAAAILRNFGTLISYRLQRLADAETLAETFVHKEIQPKDLLKIEKNNAYVRLAAGRDTIPVCSCQMDPPEPIETNLQKQNVEYLIQKTLARVKTDKELEKVEKQTEIVEVEQEIDLDISQEILH